MSKLFELNTHLIKTLKKEKEKNTHLIKVVFKFDTINNQIGSNIIHNSHQQFKQSICLNQIHLQL